MKLNTNIVLTSNQRSTQPYVLQVFPSESETGYFTLYYNNQDIINNTNIFLYSKDNQKKLFRDVNDWYDLEWEGSTHLLERMTVRLYFPQYSVDTFTPRTKHILNIATHIHGKDIELGSFLFERKNALACAPVRFNGMDEYYEYMDFTIADPYSIYSIHDQIESEFIRKVFQTIDTTTGALLHVSLFVVEESDNHYYKSDIWTGGQNNVFAYDASSLTSKLSYNIENRTLDIDVLYPDDYASSLSDYINKTYNINHFGLVVQYVVVDDNDVYYEQSKVVENVDTSIYSFSIDENEGSVLDEHAHRPSFSFDFNESYDSVIVPYKKQVDGHDFNFFDTLPDLMNTGNIPEGLNIQASVMIFRFVDGEDYPFISIVSNKLYFTQELLSQIVDTDDSLPKKINLEELDMNNISLKVTNKITQEVNVITPADSTKNHILQPVFYQTRDVGSVTIHPSVTENIAINLDSYKSQVDRFKIQVEGVIFREVGRINQGIVFKVIGNMLPKENNEGTLFVLNQDDELVTTGKYSYLF